MSRNESSSFNQPVVISVVGTFRGGKSTLINALLGAELMPASTVATTATISELAYDSRFGATVHFRKQASLEPGRQRIRAAIRECDGDAERLYNILTPPGAVLDTELEFSLGALGLLTLAGHVDVRRLETVLLKDGRSRTALPAGPFASEFGKTRLLEADTLDDLRKALAPYTAFAGSAGEFSDDASALIYSVERVEIRGPFSLLRPIEAGRSPNLRLADTPGLGDPRASPEAIVRAQLEVTDGVVLNLSRGVWSAYDKELIRILFRRGRLPGELVVVIGMADQLAGADLAAVSSKLTRDLESLLVEFGASRSDASDLARVPIVPVCALAAVERNRQQAGGRESHPANELHQSLLRRYPAPTDDGTAQLSLALRLVAAAAPERRAREAEQRRVEEARRRAEARQRAIEEEQRREAEAAARRAAAAQARAEQARRQAEEARRVEEARLFEEARQREAQLLRQRIEEEWRRARSPCAACFLPQSGASSRFRNWVEHLQYGHGLTMRDIEGICYVTEPTLRSYMSKGISNDVRDRIKRWMGR